jgi:hypothetical protein
MKKRLSTSIQNLLFLTDLTSWALFQVGRQFHVALQAGQLATPRGGFNEIFITLWRANKPLEYKPDVEKKLFKFD